MIGVFDSNGGRLDEGAAMMAAYGEILLASNNLSGVVPQIALVLGPCVGTSAMIAAGADFVVMSDKGELTLDTAGADASEKDAMSAGICHIAAGSEDDAIGGCAEPAGEIAFQQPVRSSRCGLCRCGGSRYYGGWHESSRCR